MALKEMNSFPWTCSACGKEEKSGATFNQVSDWSQPYDLVHRDPRVCADHLRAQRADLEAREAAANNKHGCDNNA